MATPTFLLPSGIVPVMLTPMKSDREIDLPMVDSLTDWYIHSGAASLFTSCWSSELYSLDESERLSLTRRVVTHTAGRVPVMAGVVFQSLNPRQMVEAIKVTAETGVDLVVCIVNQMAAQEDDDIQWEHNVDRLLTGTGDIRLGLYECPSPYHRTIKPVILSRVASTGRFFFLKETAQQSQSILSKIAAVQNTLLKVFDAKSKSLLSSLQAGGAGFCGIESNFYPALMAWLCTHYQTEPALSRQLLDFIRSTQQTLYWKYPRNAKTYLALAGLKIGAHCRVSDCELNHQEMDHLLNLRRQTEEWHQRLGIKSP